MLTTRSRPRHARVLLVVFSLTIWFTALGLTDLFHNHDFVAGHCCQSGIQPERPDCPVALLLQGVAGAALCAFTLTPVLGTEEVFSPEVAVCSTNPPIDLPQSRAPPSPAA